MALPAIMPYPMPTASDLPANRVNWTPDPKRAVLLIHDMQQYFVDAFTAGTSPVIELLENIRVLRSACEELGIPVVYSAQPGGQTLEQRGLLQDFWGPGIDDGPYQKQIVKELPPGERDIVLTKWRYSAFQKTDFRATLTQLGRDQLIVCGIYAHIGCLMTACEAFMQEVEPFFVVDAVADFSLEKHRLAITYAAERCAVAITTERFIKALRGEAGTAAQAEAISEAAPAAESGTLTKDGLRELVADLLQEAPSSLAEHDNLITQWGMDSIRIMSLAERWRRSGAEVTFVELAERPTLADWWALLSARLSRTLPNGDYITT
ncbi:isochorismatase family protein [Paenibacillus sp. MZ04-78.2]|uniref:isochorismatase family protein n=1 Tax=Paenibacillus sp. MZ04-78.2 TaxID=2962034 RepID=UPI0020B84527|nr:isochorismatase family protein [Paenibacillus sp. MZ04-78.2]MCP3773790.1 isochorismatase family protein [Paenibacillus sp. MZ04-78.2]